MATPHDIRVTSRINVLAGASACLLASAVFVIFWQDAFDNGALKPLNIRFDSPLITSFSTSAAKWCMLASLMFGIGTTMLYSGLISGDTSRFPSTVSKLLFIVHGICVSIVGLLHALQFFAISRSLGEAAPSDGIAYFRWSGLVSEGWLVFVLLFLGECALMVALIPTRVRLLARKRPTWLAWLGRGVVISGVAFAIVESRIAIALHEAPAMILESLLTGPDFRPRVTELVAAVGASTGYGATAILAVHGVLVLVFAFAYFWCYRNATHARVFISYRRSDTGLVVSRLYDRLVGRYGEGTIYKDTNSIPAAEEFRVHIQAAIRQSPVILVMIGPEWLTLSSNCELPRLFDPEDYVRLEVEEAIASQSQVVPVLCGTAQVPNRQDLPDSIHGLLDRHALRLGTDIDFESDMSRLYATIEGRVLQ